MAEPNAKKPRTDKKKLVGIRRESKSVHERRVPLVPAVVAELRKAHPMEFRVQPAPGQRIVPPEEFTAAGATVDPDLSSCDFIIGIKEIPKEEIQPDQAYCFFSHVIKGQPYNMPMLKKLMENRCTLVDYEKMVDARGARVIAFGRQAGQAGMINGFHSLNYRLQALGRTPNPFASLKQAKEYSSTTEAKAALAKVGAAVQAEGLPAFLVPMIVGITGAGNVAGGCFDILSALPNLVEWTPAQMKAKLKAKDYDNKHIYKVVFDGGDLYQSKANPDPSKFTFADFNANPKDYVSTIPEYLADLTVFVNAVFWRPEWPMFVTMEHLKQLWVSSRSTLRLLVISDITCDIKGSVECTVRSTLPDMPSYVYNPVTQDTVDGFKGEGIVIMAVDILPTEQPLESSTAFAEKLKELLPAMVLADYSASFEKLDLPPVLKNAVILHRGQLTPNFQYLTQHLAAAEAEGAEEDH
eukprot:RCo033180